MELRRIEVDGVPYEVRFQGFHQPLGVRLEGGGEVSLRPWTCQEHLRALGRHLAPQGTGVGLDAEGFCAQVLAHSGVTGKVAEALAPLALWWASGGGGVERRDVDGGVELGGLRFRLRAWTQAERMRALAGSVETRPDGGTSFDAAAYLGAMLRASVQAMEPAGQRLEDLDSATTAGLLDAVVALNVPDAEPGSALDEPRGPGAKEMAAVTLRLCRALGWTPSQVWATPAPEVDRLLRLLDLTEGSPAARSAPAPAARTGGSRLAEHPDAIVIHVEDDSE